MRFTKKRIKYLITVILIAAVLYTKLQSYSGSPDTTPETASVQESTVQPEDAGSSPQSQVLSGQDNIRLSYHGIAIPWQATETCIVLNGNHPFFSFSGMTTEPFEMYSELDDLGRCGTAFANICSELMPTEERGSIGPVKPSGWQSVRYEGIDGQYLFNRCHLIGFQLAGENANPRNLITGTRWLNTEGMLPFENEVAEYVRLTGEHVLYRVTPIFYRNPLRKPRPSCDGRG